MRCCRLTFLFPYITSENYPHNSMWNKKQQTQAPSLLSLGVIWNPVTIMYTCKAGGKVKANCLQRDVLKRSQLIECPNQESLRNGKHQVLERWGLNAPWNQGVQLKSTRGAVVHSLLSWILTSTLQGQEMGNDMSRARALGRWHWLVILMSHMRCQTLHLPAFQCDSQTYTLLTGDYSSAWAAPETDQQILIFGGLSMKKAVHNLIIL